MVQMRRRAGRMGARKIYETLRDQIMERVYGVDGMLPSSRALEDGVRFEIEAVVVWKRGDDR